MISGSFANAFMSPFSATATLLALVATGLWIALLGSKEKWRMTVAVLLGLAAGALLPGLGVALPFPGWVLPGSVVALGILVALDVVVVAWIALAVTTAIYVYHGTAVAPRGGDLMTWLGFAVGTVTALAAGIGFDSMIVHATSARGVRVFGGIIALGGGWLLVQAV